MIVNIVVNGQTTPVDINDIINKDITSDLFEFKEDLENILPNSENKIIYQKNKNFICLFEGMGIVLDTGGFASRNPTQLDISTNW